MCFCLTSQQTKGKKGFNFSGWHNFTTEGNKFSPSMTGISGNCVSFAPSHHVKVDSGVSIKMSTIIKRLENISFLLPHFEVTSSFCIRTHLWYWNLPKAWVSFHPSLQSLHPLYSISGATEQLLFWNTILSYKYALLKNLCALSKHDAIFELWLLVESNFQT